MLRGRDDPLRRRNDTPRGRDDTLRRRNATRSESGTRHAQRECGSSLVSRVLPPSSVLRFLDPEVSLDFRKTQVYDGGRLTAQRNI